MNDSPPLTLFFSVQRLGFVLVVTLAVWLVADFEVITYQDTMKLDKRENLETGTATPINYTACVRPA